MESKKNDTMNLFPKQKKMHRHENKLIITKGKRGWWEGKIRRLRLTYTHYYI